MQQIATSKQAILLRYFNNMFHNPEDQFPRALTIDEQILLAGTNLKGTLKQRELFRIVTVEEDLMSNVASTSSSLSSNTGTDFHPTL